MGRRNSFTLTRMTVTRPRLDIMASYDLAYHKKKKKIDSARLVDVKNTDELCTESW
jgi:hypothetical protein